ncbi:hypothetical protein AKJ16_DCAP06351 [Drosera capensis]
MVSFQSPFFSKDQRNLILVFEDSSSSTSTNKRKRVEDDQGSEADHGILHGHDQRKNPRSFSDLGLHLDTSLPSQSQRFLDIQSGQIHFYNTETHKRTHKDPRESAEVKPEPASPRRHMSLDLDLNLPCGSCTTSVNKESNNKNLIKKRQDTDTKLQINTGISFMKGMKGMSDKDGSPALSLWSSSLEADDQQQQEMVATVCTRCHMLVMLFKNSPSCPNCKFMHPPDYTPPTLFKPKLSLLCFNN